MNVCACVCAFLSIFFCSLPISISFSFSFPLSTSPILFINLLILQVELERKVSSLTITKENYKKKWKETRSELSKFHHCEQKATREKLLSQDKELAEMHMQHIQHKEESDLTLQIGKVKDDLQRYGVIVLNPTMHGVFRSSIFLSISHLGRRRFIPMMLSYIMCLHIFQVGTKDFL